MKFSMLERIASAQRPMASRAVFASLLLAALAVAILAGSALAAGNLIKNGSFEKDTNGDGVPNNWTGNINLTPADKRVCNQSYAGTCSFKLVGDGTEKYLSQIVSLPGGTQGESFQLNVWAKGKNTVLGSGIVLIQMIILHTDGDSLDNYYAYIPAGNTPWTKYTINGEATENFNNINVVLFSSADSGKAWFDKVKLVAAP